MQWISISDSSIMIGICEKKSETGTISRIFKKPLINSNDSVFFLNELQKTLSEILSSIDKKIITDNKLAISIPIEKSAIFRNIIDNGLSDQESEDVLNWKMQINLPESKDLFVQHYPISKINDNGEKVYISIAINKKMRDIIITTMLENNFEPVFMDMSIFSAYNLLIKSFPLQAYNRWGIWNVAQENQIHNLLISNNNIISFISFKILEDSKVLLLQNTDPANINEQFIEKILKKDYSDLNFDKMFVYSQFPNNPYVLDYIDNDKHIVINPLPILSNQKVQIEKKYLKDKFLLSQFVEIAGLISRF